MNKERKPRHRIQFDASEDVYNELQAEPIMGTAIKEALKIRKLLKEATAEGKKIILRAEDGTETQLAILFI